MTVFMVGDVHGHLDKLMTLLTDAELLDDSRKWNGGSACLWFVGDFFDRGPQGVGVVDLIMRLQSEAEDAGGEVRALLGNHEVLFLGAHRFQRINKFKLSWKRNGGQDADLALVSARQIAWLRALPAMAQVENRLLIHADAMFYLNYGQSIDAVNEKCAELLRSDSLEDWDQLLENFAERMAFASPRVNGSANIAEMLRVFGGEQIIHGHTPIQYMMGDAAEPTEPLSYAQDLCVDVDGGMYLGAPGFVYRLPE